ncbi:MAG: hypothetical protein WC220_00180 [Pedobacter sp.]|jgi:hypothetical protein
MTFKLPKRLDDQKQIDIFEKYQASLPELDKIYGEHVGNEIEIMRSPEGENILVAYWTNFYDGIVPETDAVLINVEVHGKEDEFDTYAIDHQALMTLLKDNVEVLTTSMNLFVIKGVTSAELKEKILQNSQKFE